MPDHRFPSRRGRDRVHIAPTPLVHRPPNEEVPMSPENPQGSIAVQSTQLVNVTVEQEFDPDEPTTFQPSSPPLTFGPLRSSGPVPYIPQSTA
ncbi:hypothetical protein CVT26_015674 [Gymnopilus dilepis]|uniref:Uncharacterized protein n=1 Tax=Gymnopilus dilepis TaxID=231916 RepID=A0A409VFB7_9AGAR|nr:hypothetical protein CVT26_015674 [Gymnopilus dilepis]